MTSGGTILGRPLSAVFLVRRFFGGLAELNLPLWIRNDLPPARRAAITFKGIPDKRNDQRKGSHLWENRRKNRHKAIRRGSLEKYGKL